MNNKRVGVMLLFLVLLVQLASAFELSSDDIVRSTCQGNTILFTADIFEEGNFNVNMDGSASSWSTAVPDWFVIRNNSRQIYVYSTPNDNVNPGKYNLNLIVSNEKETKKISFTINVKNCHSLQLIGDALKEICGGNVVSYNYQIKNLGNYNENYLLKLKGPEFITLSQNKISISPGETKNVYAYVAQNSESSKFTISAFNKYGISEINSELKVNSCYDFSLSTNRDFVNFCEHSQEKVIIDVKNLGIRQDAYNLEIKGPEWANLEKNKLVLNPGKSEKVNLILSPGYSVNGNFDIKLNVNSIDSSKTGIVRAQVNKCNDVFIDIKDKEINLCNNVKIPVHIRNTGLFNKEFRLETSEQWASFDNYQLKLKPNEEKNLNLMLNVENMERRSYYLYAIIFALDDSGLSMDDNIKINLLDQNQCYNIEIISDSQILVKQSSSSTLPITIKNNGNEKLTYQLGISGDGTSFTQLNPSILEINQGSSETVYLYSAPSLEIYPGVYNININVLYNNNLLNSKNININVKESLIDENKEYIPFSFKIAGFFANLFPERIKNETMKESQPEIEKPYDIGFDLRDDMNESEQENKEYIPFSFKIVNFFAKLFPEKISNETAEESKQEIEEQKGNITENINKTNFISGFYEKAKPYWLYGLIGLIIILVLIFIFSSNEKEDEEKEFEEDSEDDIIEDEEDKKPSKIGRWIFAIVTIVAVAYAQIKYDLFGYAKKYMVRYFDYAEVYKFYIFVALIIILITVLIVKYWSSIIDFFEDEEEIPRKGKKKKK